jgi:phenylpyruvate tautomerase
MVNQHAAKLYPLVSKHLGVPSDRMYMFFQDATTSQVGFQATTFHELFG